MFVLLSGLSSWSLSYFLTIWFLYTFIFTISNLSSSDFLKSRVFQNSLYTAQEHRKIAKILLCNLLDVVRRNLRVILQYLINACMLVDWLESTRSLSPAIFSTNGPSSAKVSSLPITSYLTGKGWQFFRLDAKDDRAIYY